MKAIFSRKGFDSAAGKAASPIINGQPISMPIPATKSSATTYNDLGLGDVVKRVTSGRIAAGDLCHHDPMFVGGDCWFGQCGTAQSHLANQGVGPGDVFLFFGLFADETTGERHHRFFGYLKVRAVLRINQAAPEIVAHLKSLKHPHVLRISDTNNTVYHGEGAAAAKALESLRLTIPGGPLSRWSVPPWLCELGLTYHGAAKRWIGATELVSVARGQEFVCDIGEHAAAHAWVNEIITMIRS